MDSTIEHAALLALLRENARNWSAIVNDVEDTRSALAVLRSELAAGQGDLLAPDPEHRVADLLASATQAIDGWRGDGLNLVTMFDEGYPAQLREVAQQPPFLFYRGAFRAADARGVAVVGTRHPTSQGEEQATEIAAGLARRGVVVVSGLAEGIDTAAHVGALEAGGRTVAVIGTGIRQTFPKKNAALQELLATEHLVISQFWPDSAPTRFSFPMRNAVMSGYASATVVVEAGARSGARMQARLALEHNRPVFLLKSLLVHDWAQDYAARPGTMVVNDVAEVLDALDLMARPVGALSLG